MQHGMQREIFSVQRICETDVEIKEQPQPPGACHRASFNKYYRSTSCLMPVRVFSPAAGADRCRQQRKTKARSLPLRPEEPVPSSVPTPRPVWGWSH
jgi:hypothetical protein